MPIKGKSHLAAESSDFSMQSLILQGCLSAQLNLGLRGGPTSIICDITIHFEANPVMLFMLKSVNIHRCIL